MELIKRIRTTSGDAQIDYLSLANLPSSDATLTKSGSFADAAVVGTKITQIEKDIKDMPSILDDTNREIEKLKTAVSDLQYVPISINSFTNDKNIVEMGTTISTIVLNWSTNKTPTTLTLDGSTLSPSIKTTTLSGQSVKTNKTFTLKAVDERNASSSKTTSITFYNGVYYGAASAGTVNNAFIQKLSKALQSNKAKTFDVTTGAGQYIWYAIPSRYGTPSFNVGGFDGGFSKVSTVSYTNPSGYTENYDVYRSDNSNLGKKTVKVS